MSACENIDGQCADSWCDCDYQRRKRELAASNCSPTHVHIEMITPHGNVARIIGDPNMPEATQKALAEMIDAAVKAANNGQLKAAGNK